MSWIAAGVAVVGGGIKIFGGIKQKKAAKKLKAENDAAQKALDGTNAQTLRQAEEMAQQGMPSQEYAMNLQNIARSQNNAIQSAQSRRAGIGLIGAIQQNTNDATLRLDSANARERNQNKRAVIALRNSQAAGTNANVQRDRDYAFGLMGAGNANIYSGVDQSIAGVGQGVSAYYGSNAPTGGESYDNLSGRTPRASKVNTSTIPYR